MKKRRSDTYEVQLSPDELQTLYTALLQPDANFPQIQANAVPWRSGPFTGTKPSIRTLSNIASRLRVENLTAEISSTSRAIRATKSKMEADPEMGLDPWRLMQKIFVLLAQETLEKSVKREDPRSRACLIRLLQRQHQIIFEYTKWQNVSVQQISDWYWHGPGKKWIEAQKARNRGQLIEKLGRAMFGDSWDPKPVPPYSINHPSAPELDPEVFEDTQPANSESKPQQPVSPAGSEPSKPTTPPDGTKPSEQAPPDEPKTAT